ncbi:TPA: hypothetical protein QIM62_004784 [Klebsiella aerogenes]|nr:hypothetical protein [Klebsiella aerogenes]
MLIQGVSLKDIAVILGFSRSTVYVYRTKLSAKMQFSHRAVPASAL